MSEARRVAEYLAKQEERDQQQSKTSKIALRRKEVLRVMLLKPIRDVLFTVTGLRFAPKP